MIYMTKDEWHKIADIIKNNDYYTLVDEIIDNTCDLNINEQELDGIIKDYKENKKFDKNQNSYYL